MFYSSPFLWYASFTEAYFYLVCYFVRRLSIMIFIRFFSLFSLSFFSFFFLFLACPASGALSGTTQLGIGAFRRGGGTALDGNVCAPIGRDRTRRWRRVGSRVREQQSERPQRVKASARQLHRPLGNHGRFADRPRVTINERTVESNAPEMNTLQTCSHTTSDL